MITFWHAIDNDDGLLLTMIFFKVTLNPDTDYSKLQWLFECCYLREAAIVLEA